MPNVFSHITDETFTYGDQKHLHNFLVTDNCEAETDEELADEEGTHTHVFTDDDDVECRTGPASNFDPTNHYHRLDGED